MAFDLCRDLTKSDEPTDLGSLRFVEICPLPSSLTWLSDGGKRFRARFALDLESLGQPATPSRLVVPTREASEGDRPSHVGVFGRVCEAVGRVEVGLVKPPLRSHFPEKPAAIHSALGTGCLEQSYRQKSVHGDQEHKQGPLTKSLSRSDGSGWFKLSLAQEIGELDEPLFLELGLGHSIELGRVHLGSIRSRHPCGDNWMMPETCSRRGQRNPLSAFYEQAGR
jgi:hypothetical protein